MAITLEPMQYNDEILIPFEILNCGILCLKSMLWLEVPSISVWTERGCKEIRRTHQSLSLFFVQEIQTKGDGFKLLNMVADRKNGLYRKNCVIHTILPSWPEFSLAITMLFNLKPSLVNIIVKV